MKSYAADACLYRHDNVNCFRTRRLVYVLRTCRRWWLMTAIHWSCDVTDGMSSFGTQSSANCEWHCCVVARTTFRMVFSVSRTSSSSLLVGFTSTLRRDHGGTGPGGLDPWKYVGRVRACFDPLKCHKLLLDNSASFTSCRTNDLCQKCKVKPILMRLKQFDGLTWLTPIPLFYGRYTPLETRSIRDLPTSDLVCIFVPSPRRRHFSHHDVFPQSYLLHAFVQIQVQTDQIFPMPKCHKVTSCCTNLTALKMQQMWWEIIQTSRNVQRKCCKLSVVVG